MIKPSQIKTNKNNIKNIFKKFKVELNENNINYFLSEVLDNITVINENGDPFFEDIYYFENHK
jgi:hypothetical protein|tara:strand:- start:7 stop:195 length:189 start_codon:yes stop_codon:yes gene_type:complete